MCRDVLGAGPQAACAASRCGPLEPPFLSIPPLKDALKVERSSTGGPEHDVQQSEQEIGPEHDVQQSEQEISRDWRDRAEISIIDGTLTKFVEMLWDIIAPRVD